MEKEKNILKSVQTRLEIENFKYEKEKLVEYANVLDTMGILPEMSEKELYVFLKYCFSLGLNPLYGEVYCVPFKKGGKTIMTPVIAYSQYIKRASRHPKYQLPQTTIVLNDPEGKPLPQDKIHVIVSVKRKDDDTIFQKVYYMCEWRKNTPVWNNQPIDMLQTRAIKNALAICYPEEVAALEQYETAAEVEVIELDNTDKAKQLSTIKKVIGK